LVVDVDRRQAGGVQLFQCAGDGGRTEGPTTRRAQPSGELVDALWPAAVAGPATGAGEDQVLLAVPVAAGVLTWAGITLAPGGRGVLMSLSTIVVTLKAQLLVDLRSNEV
jgi:hypothetical protein